METTTHGTQGKGLARAPSIPLAVMFPTSFQSRTKPSRGIPHVDGTGSGSYNRPALMRLAVSESVVADFSVQSLCIGLSSPC